MVRLQQQGIALWCASINTETKLINKSQFKLRIKCDWLHLMSHYNHWAEAAQHHSKYAVAKCCSLSCWSPCCLDNVLIISSAHGCKTDQNGFESYKVDAKWFVDLYGANLENEIKK